MPAPTQPPLPGPPPVPPPPIPAPAGREEDSSAVRLLLPVGRSVLAIVAGYLGLISVLLVPAPFALLTGILAVIDIQKSKATKRRKYGLGRAIFGIAMGAVFTAGLLAVIVFSVFSITRR